MNHDLWFESAENRALMVVCARKLIRNIGIGGIIWGVINIAVGVVAIQATIVNSGILILGVIMMGAGVQALRKPSLGVLLTETIATALLFVWNLAISIINLLAGYAFEPRGLLFPLIIAVVFANYYRKLGHLREQIASIDPGTIKATREVCKGILKKKLKDEPLTVQTTDHKCRAQLMDGQAFFIQNDFMRAFVGPKESVRGAVVNPGAKKLSMAFNHPLGKLKYSFDKNNSEKINNWLSTNPAPTTG